MYNNIGIVGAGNMGGAIIKGLLNAGTDPSTLFVACGYPEEATVVAECYGVETTTQAHLVASSADLLILAVKPNTLLEILPDIALHCALDVLVLSVAAGVSTAQIEKLLGRVSVIRAMPNLNAMVGKATTSISPGKFVNDTQLAQARTVLETIGTVVEVPEHLVDAVTGLSGSGPAWMFMMLEGMIQAGVQLGLSKDVATTLSVATMVGSGTTIAETGADPAVVRSQVCSPGGTTIAGVNQLEHDGFKSAVINACVAAAKRSAKMGKTK